METVETAPSLELQALKPGFDSVERVVADPLRFKLRLGIGDDAYASLRLKKTLQQIWDVGGMAATGAGVVASPTVAATFFGYTASGGMLSWIGLGTAAATPLGWVIAAAFVSGAGYYGVTRLFGGYAGSRVETIPKFINTPIDLLGASLFDLLGALAVRVGRIDGYLDPRERAVIVDRFVADWGYDAAYLDRALTVLEAADPDARLKAIGASLGAFLLDNPDCNPAAIHAWLVTMLRDLAAADGILDEREDLAIEAIDRQLREAFATSLTSVGRSVAAWAGKAGGAVRGLADRVTTAASGAIRRA